MELLAYDEDLFYSIDELAGNKRLKLRNMMIHPVIVYTNAYLEIPAFRDHLDDIIQKRPTPVKEHFKHIDSFKLVQLKFFFERIIAFANSNLELYEEFEYINDQIRKQKLKAQKTLNLDDWFIVYAPFSFMYSQKCRDVLPHTKYDIQRAIIDCWQIEPM